MPLIMGCNCINRKKKDFQLVRKLAERFARVIQADVRVYQKHLPGTGLIYDFEPAEIYRGNDHVIEIIKPQL